MCCNVLQCVAVRCSVLQCVSVCYSSVQCVAVCCNVLHARCNSPDAVCCMLLSVLYIKYIDVEQTKEVML